jgi:hypothetical protein
MWVGYGRMMGTWDGYVGWDVDWDVDWDVVWACGLGCGLGMWIGMWFRDVDWDVDWDVVWVFLASLLCNASTFQTATYYKCNPSS